MPIYEYECQKCKRVIEVRQSFSDDPLTRCEECSGDLHKLFSPPAIIFKGKGFHCTDYAKSGSTSSKSSCSTCPKSSDASCDVAKKDAAAG